jgi:hypothetical protein
VTCVARRSSHFAAHQTGESVSGIGNASAGDVKPHAKAEQETPGENP